MPRRVLAELEAGEESVNHMEQIALDMGALLSNQLPALSHHANCLRNGGLVKKMRRGGEILLNELGLDVVGVAQGWKSDTMRGWGAMAVGAAADLSLEDRLLLIEPFAEDDHFAVREWAWLSLRPHVASDVDHSLRCLVPWTRRASDRQRRFAVEVTRPRGVWSVHIPTLKASPHLAEPLLDPLQADASRYVQDSVANWINDASKTASAWAFELCGRWSDTQHPATERICRRALRFTRKQNR